MTRVKPYTSGCASVHDASAPPGGPARRAPSPPDRPKSSSDRAAIAAMMAITTITIRTSTKKRLSDYKWGERTYDEVLSMLMDRVPLEDISREQIREHYRRLEAFKGGPKEEFKAKVRRTSRA